MSEAAVAERLVVFGRLWAMGWCVVCVLVAMMVLVEAGFAQQTVSPDTVTFLGHVVRMAPLEASENAGAAQGTVVLSVEVGTDGSVIAAKAISGPAVLVPAAVACAKQWKFRPFKENGKKVIAEGKLSFTFGQANVGLVSTGHAAAASARAVEKPGGAVANAKGAAAGSASANAPVKFSSLWEECSQSMVHHMPAEETAVACKRAADRAAEFPTETHYLQKRSAFVYAATAFANAGDFKAGQAYAEKAVEMANSHRHKEPGDGEVYSMLGHIEAMQGDFEDADVSMSSAEDYDRKSIAWAKKKKETAWVTGYTGALQADLRFHALVLKDLKRKHESKEKLKEADRLTLPQ